jgi:hypothetical protein
VSTEEGSGKVGFMDISICGAAKVESYDAHNSFLHIRQQQISLVSSLLL